MVRPLPLLLLVACAKLPTVEPVAGGTAANGIFYALPKNTLVAELDVEKTSVTPGVCSDFVDRAGLDSCLNDPTGATCSARIQVMQAGLTDDAVPTKASTFKIVGSRIDVRSYADPAAVFNVLVPDNIAADFKLDLTWTADGRLGTSSTESTSKAAEWVASSLDVLGSLVSSVAGAARPGATIVGITPKPSSKVAVCEAAASHVIELDGRIETLSAGGLADTSRDALVWTLETLTARRNAVAAAFTGDVLKVKGTVRCEVGPDAATGNVKLFSFDKDVGVKLDGVSTCTMPSSLAGAATTPVKLDWKATPWVLGANLAPASNSIQHAYYYRIPAWVDASIGDPANQAGTLTRVSVALPQFGVLAALPMVSGRGGATASVTVDATTGMLTNLSVGATAVDIGAAADSVSGLVDAAVNHSNQRFDAETARIRAETDRLTAERERLEARQALDAAQSPTP